MLNANPQSNLITKEEADRALSKASNVCPKKIVIDRRLIEPSHGVNTLNFFYASQPYLFAKLQDSCGIKYKTSQCGQNICIVET